MTTEQLYHPQDKCILPSDLRFLSSANSLGGGHSTNDTGRYFEQNIGDKMPVELMDEYQPLLIKGIEDTKVGGL